MRLTATAVLTLGLALAPAVAAHAAAGDDEADRAARWREIRQSIFGDRTVETGPALVTLDVPERALDASLVPLTLAMPGGDAVKGVTLVIDDNPSPFAAHFAFGPAADPEALKLRVRVNSYTNLHAVAETRDGRLVETTRFVKASGGCSAPMGMSDEEAMRGMGDMRMKFADAKPGRPVEATLMIRHPNFTGLQMNQVSREYTPARYINRISVTDGDRSVFTMEGDISISANPVMTFAMLPEVRGPIRVEASDNQGGHWAHSFDAPTAGH